MSKRIELGCAGHFICSDRCAWRRHTQVGDYRISTVGDLYINDDRTTVGWNERGDAWFETMVFRTTGSVAKGSEGCGCYEIDDYSELECDRYATAGEANAGHERMVQKYEEQ